jgi:hypothetical protein
MLIKTVKYDGTGDYTNITTAFDDMLVSGIAATGSISEYLMLVDSYTYSGTLSGNIPYSGVFKIIGSGTYFRLTDSISNISGTYKSYFTPNLILENMIIDCSGLNTYTANIPSGFGLELNNIQLINDISGFYNLGVIKLNKFDSCGISGYSNNFITSSGFETISDSNISNYKIAIQSNNLNISTSSIHHNNSGIFYDTNFNIIIDKSLIYGNYKNIQVNSGYCYITQSTIDNITISNTYLTCDQCIVNNNISGVALSGSYIYNSKISSSLDSNISVSGNISDDPKFNNTSVGDYRLKFKQTEGSPAIEVKRNLNYDSSITVYIDQSKFQIYDNFGIFKNYEFLSYIYIQSSTIVFSDYNREIKFAELKNLYKKLFYKLYSNIQFNEYNVLTDSTLNININQNDPHPYDWDYKELNTTQIIDYNKYIFPRSFINVENIISQKIPNLPLNISFSTINKDNIKPYIIQNFRGITYDYYISSPGNSIVWTIDGSNQSLIKKDIYNNEYIENYPLLSLKPSKSIIRPSGIIYTGVNGDYYNFIKQDDVNFKLLSLSENGDFYFISTQIDQSVDLRGIKTYKDNLLITAGKYSPDITDRLLIQSGNPVGYLFWYNNNDLFLNYTKPIDSINKSILASGNYYPTDITVYEDGTILIADYYSPSGLYKYNLCYDYCLINSNYDNETKVLLREYYSNIEI